MHHSFRPTLYALRCSVLDKLEQQREYSSSKGGAAECVDATFTQMSDLVVKVSIPFQREKQIKAQHFAVLESMQFAFRISKSLFALRTNLFSADATFLRIRRGRMILRAARRYCGVVIIGEQA